MNPMRQGSSVISKETPEKHTKFLATYERSFKITHSNKKSNQFSPDIRLKKTHLLIEPNRKPLQSYPSIFELDPLDAQPFFTPEKSSLKILHKFGTSDKHLQQYKIRPFTSQPDHYHYRTTSIFSNIGARLQSEEKDTNQNTIDIGKVPNSSEIYLMNKKKYTLQMPSYSLVSSSKRTKSQIDEMIYKAKEGIRFARQHKRHPIKSLIQVQRLHSIHELNKIAESAPVDKDAERKITILRKKIAISQMFDSEFSPNEKQKKNLSTENRKNIYKSLLLEYHPDKSKHSKEVANEISNFLLNNKQLFIEGASAQC